MSKMRGNDKEEADDIAAEEEFWREYKGRTSCLGLVAEAGMFVIAIVAISIELLA